MPNKLTAEVKKKVQSLLDGAIDSIDLSKFTTAERIRLIEIHFTYNEAGRKNPWNRVSKHKLQRFDKVCGLRERDMWEKERKTKESR